MLQMAGTKNFRTVTQKSGYNTKNSVYQILRQQNSCYVNIKLTCHMSIRRILFECTSTVRNTENRLPQKALQWLSYIRKSTSRQSETVCLALKGPWTLGQVTRSWENLMVVCDTDLMNSKRPRQQPLEYVTYFGTCKLYTIGLANRKGL